jgi:hypothetical protein
MSRTTISASVANLNWREGARRQRSPLRSPAFTLAITVLVLWLATACAPAASRQSSIVGKWVRAPTPTAVPTEGPTPTPSVHKDFLGTPRVMPTASIVIDPCKAFYPQTLEFFTDGTYARQAGNVWNGGDYEVMDDGRLKLSTAKGGISVYTFSVSGDTLVIQAMDVLVCEMHYERAE